jgi:DNA-binding response OmpR family regulator
MPKKILIVEDSRYVRAVLTNALKKSGFDVVCVEDAESGHLEILQMSGKPDLIILDLNLPALEGEDLGVMLKGMDETAKIPIVIFSARPEEEIKKAVELAGARGYVKKDQDLKLCTTQLINKIKNILS